VSDEKIQDQASATVRPRLGRALARLIGEAEGSAAAPIAEVAVTPEAEDGFSKGQPGEHGGPKGPEPTRYGDWERKGRCVDF
jgi:hypothetical protein